MKKLISGFFALAMLLSSVFVSGAISSNNPLSVKAQEVTVKKKSKGIASKTWSGTKYVYRKAAGGARFVYRKTAQGTVYVGKQTWKGGKWTYNKGKRGTKAFVSRTKKILN
jgi:predicted RNA-binding protein